MIVVDAARDRTDALRPHAADRRRVTELVDQRAGLAHASGQRRHHRKGRGCRDHLLLQPRHRRLAVHALEEIGRTVEVAVDERGLAAGTLHQAMQLGTHAVRRRRRVALDPILQARALVAHSRCVGPVTPDTQRQQYREQLPVR